MNDNQPVPANRPYVPVRWIVTDLDGTLLDSRQQIGTELVKRIARFTAAGGRFTFATGRTLRSAMPYIALLQLQSPVILFNGARIYDPVTDTYLIEHCLDAAAVQQVMRLHEQSPAAGRLNLLLYNREQIFTTSMSDQVRTQMNKDGVTVDTVLPQWLESIVDNITKLMLIGPEPDIIELQRQVAAIPLNCVQSEPHLLEIMPIGINKSTALSAVMRLSGEQADGFAAVGDNMNDLEMIGSVRNGFAVANANPIVKKAAKHVLARSNETAALLEVIDFAESTW